MTTRCGAATATGVCARKVAYEGFRCHQHLPRTPEEKAADRERRRKIQNARDASDEAHFLRDDFSRDAAKYGLDAPETREAYEKWRAAWIAAGNPWGFFKVE